MIALLSRNLLFIKTRKTASTSVEVALSRFATDRDVLTPLSPADENLRKSLGYSGAQNWENPWVGSSRTSISAGDEIDSQHSAYNHMSLVEAAQFLGETVDSLHVVSVVRNPWERVISRYYYNRSEPMKSVDGFRAWLLKNPSVIAENEKQLESAENSNSIQYLRFESLSRDAARLASRFSLDHQFVDDIIRVRCKSTFRPHSATVEMLFSGFTEGIALVEREAASVITEFGYSICSSGIGSLDRNPGKRTPATLLQT